MNRKYDKPKEDEISDDEQDDLEVEYQDILNQE